MNTKFDCDIVNGLSNAVCGRVDLLEKMLGVKVRENLRYSDIQKIVKSGFAEEFFDLGDEIMTKYTATDGTEYDFPWRIVDFRDVYWENDPNPHPGMVLQSVYATAETIVPGFNVSRHTVDPSEEEAQEGYYYYGQDQSTQRIRALDLKPGDPIPHDEYSPIYKRAIEYSDTSSIGDYIYTNVRQWLNSNKLSGEWWTAQFTDEIKPSQADTYNGFMHGFEEDFLNCIKPIRLFIYTYYAPDGLYLPQPSTIALYDRFYIPSAIELYIYAENYKTGPYSVNPGEDKVFEYYKEEGKKEGHNSAFWSASPSRVFYILNNKTSAVSTKTRTTLPFMGSNSVDLFPNGSSAVLNSVSSAKNHIPCCVIS